MFQVSVLDIFYVIFQGPKVNVSIILFHFFNMLITLNRSNHYNDDY